MRDIVGRRCVIRGAPTTSGFYPYIGEVTYVSKVLPKGSLVDFYNSDGIKLKHGVICEHWTGVVDLKMDFGYPPGDAYHRVYTHWIPAKYLHPLEEDLDTASCDARRHTGAHA